MTPDQQEAESHKYIARQVCAIPLASGNWALYEGYGGNRLELIIAEPAAILEYLNRDFADLKLKSVIYATKAKASIITSSEIDDLINNLDL